MQKRNLFLALGLTLALGMQNGVMAAQIKDDHGKMQYVKVIDLEHHFATENLFTEYKKAYQSAEGAGKGNIQINRSPLCTDATITDLDEVRLRNMDKAGIDYAHISMTTPGAEGFSVEVGKKIAIEHNNKLGEAIKKHPDRIGGYMALVPGDVEWSLKEIDRCLKMGLWGWSTFSNYSDGTRLDDPKYLPLLARCNELKMPVFLHPFFPVKNGDIMEVGYTLFGPNYGFTVDTQLTFLRMIFRGIFDKYPNLKIILGHNAEGLAIYADRVDTAYRQNAGNPDPEFGSVKHRPSYYLKHNLMGDTSGNFMSEVMYFTKDVFGRNFLVLGTDSPYEDVKASVDLVAKDKKFTFAEKKAILQDNAESVGIGINHLKK